MQVFFIKTAFLWHLFNVCEWGLKNIQIPPSGSEKSSLPLPWSKQNPSPVLNGNSLIDMVHFIMM